MNIELAAKSINIGEAPCRCFFMRRTEPTIAPLRTPLGYLQGVYTPCVYLLGRGPLRAPVHPHAVAHSGIEPAYAINRFAA